MRTSAILTFVLTFVSITRGQTIIAGTLIGSDGKPMAKAEVHLIKLGQSTPIDSVEVSKGGTYRISTDQMGPFLLQYSGTDHHPGSVLVATEEPVKETITVTLTTKTHAQPEVVFANPSSSTARAASVYTEWMRQRDAMLLALERHLNEGKAGEFTYDASGRWKEFSRKYTNEKDPLVKQVLLLGQVGLAHWNRPERSDLLTDFLSQAVKRISPTSSLWSLDAGLVNLIGAMAAGYGPTTKSPLPPREKKTYRQFVDEFLEKNPDAQGKANIIYYKLMSAKDRGDHQAVTKYYDLLMTEFADMPIAQLAKKHISPSHTIAVGRTVPRFSLVSMDDPKTIYTNESFSGKIYLMDFWATWCVPCVAELQYLHRAYEEFKTKNFEILSISFDATPEVVANFRRGKWKMPWLHSFLENGYANPISKEFEVMIPKPILVDGNTGTILAMDRELRGQNLKETLGKFLGEAR